MIQLSVFITPIGAEPLALRSPVHFLGLPGIDTTARETQGREAHGFHGDGARENHQVGPGNLATVLLLDWPEQSVRLVQVSVIGPTVQRREALQTTVGATPAVDGSVGARTVPGHTYEKGPVVTEVRRPPVLRSRHQLFEIRLQRIEVETFKLFRIVEVVTQGIGFPRRLAQWIEVQPVGPPIVVGRCTVLGNRRVYRRDRRDPNRQQGNYTYGSSEREVVLRIASRRSVFVEPDAADTVIVSVTVATIARQR